MPIDFLKLIGDIIKIIIMVDKIFEKSCEKFIETINILKSYK